MKKLVRKGNVKEVYQTHEDRLEFVFPDQIHVYDKLMPDEIPRKGETLCKTSSYWFQEIEKRGIKNHFIERIEDDRMEVEEIEFIEDYDKLDEDTTDYLIPLKFITRYFVTRSLHDRIERGEVDHEELGFDEKPACGEKLPKPFLEVITKLEEKDKRLPKEEALSISGLTEAEYEGIKETCFEIDQIIADKVEKNGLLHVEGKKEFAIDEHGDLMVVDSFGTADEDTFWEKDEYERGNFVQRIKEHIKEYYREVGYHDELMEARSEGEEEPPLPSLPEEKIEETSELYLELMFRLTDGRYQKR